MWARLRLSWTVLLCRVPGIAAAIRGVTKAECLRVCQYMHHTGCQPQSSLNCVAWPPAVACPGGCSYSASRRREQSVWHLQGRWFGEACYFLCIPMSSYVARPAHIQEVDAKIPKPFYKGACAHGAKGCLLLAACQSDFNGNVK